MLITCCLLILAMYVDIFSFSVALPAAACDLQLSTSQQAMLSAIPLIGVMLSSYGWGLCADTLGRRTTLLGAMTVGAILNLSVSFAPSYAFLATLKFFSAAFTASANAAAFVLLGEVTPRRHRNQFMFLMASTTMFSQLCICLFALPIFNMSFSIQIPLMSLDYRPWRLLLQVISLPGIFGVISLLFLHESPKFLLSKDKEDAALEIMKIIHASNGETKKDIFPVTSVYIEEILATQHTKSFIKHMWNQTAPLFKAPLLENNLKLYFILLCAYMTSTGYTMWVTTMTNAFFSDDNTAGKTFCEVASAAGNSGNSSISYEDCDSVIQRSTLFAVMCYSGISGTINIILSFVVRFIGRRITTLLVFTVSAISGIALLFVKIPLLSIVLFYIFLYVALILGNANSYLVELNPTHLRGMATCLSVVVARGFGFFSVQLIATLLADHCTPMISGYVLLVIAGLSVAYFLPTDPNEPSNVKVSSTNNCSAEMESGHTKTRF